jgi:hypothetical protein
MRNVRDSATVIPLLLSVAFALLTGCATERLAWDKPGVTTADRERDENACLRSAIGTEQGRILAPYCIDRDVYTRCMQTRGYAVRSE